MQSLREGNIGRAKVVLVVAVCQSADVKGGDGDVESDG